MQNVAEDLHRTIGKIWYADCMQTDTGARKFWKGMFTSYITIIILCFLIYETIVVSVSYHLGMRRYQLENDSLLEKARTELDQRFDAFNRIVSSINYSESIRALHKVLVEGADMTGTDYSTIQTDMRQTEATLGGFVVDDLLLLLNDRSLAFSPTGMLSLDSPFRAVQYPKPYLYRDTVNHLFGLDSSRVTLSTDALLYCDAFKFYGGSNRGVIVVVCNLDRMERDMVASLGSNPFRIVYQGAPILEHGSFPEGIRTSSVSSRRIKDLKIVVAFSPYAFFAEDLRLCILPVSLGIMLSLLFLLMAFRYSQKYYRPIKEIRNLIPTRGDELDDTIERLKGIIGVYSGYEETLTTISPYVEQGVLHGMVTKGTSPVNVSITRQFLDLDKPYYAVLAVDFQNDDDSEDAVIRMENVFASDRVRLYHYRRSPHQYFVVITMEDEHVLDDLVDSIHKFLIDAMQPSCAVTIGVDDSRNDIIEFRDACANALSALKLMSARGRGDVYYYEPENDAAGTEYDFDPNAEAVLTQLVNEGDAKGVQTYLSGVLRTNEMRHELSPETVAALSDELHYTCIRVIKNLALSGSDVQIDRVREGMTVDEIFAYYVNALDMLINVVKQQKPSNDRTRQIIAYVDDMYVSPSLSLSLLMERFSVSGKYVTMLFKKTFGVTYLQYVSGKRIQRAKELIISTDEDLETIAEKCGYTNAMTFRRNFKETTGLIPSRFREEQRMQH